MSVTKRAMLLSLLCGATSTVLPRAASAQSAEEFYRGKSIKVTPTIRKNAATLHSFGGSPIGNSRVKLTNVDDCVKRGLLHSPGIRYNSAVAPSVQFLGPTPILREAAAARSTSAPVLHLRSRGPNMSPVH